jgi:hypothetical protein
MIKKLGYAVSEWKIGEKRFSLSLSFSPLSNDVKTITLQFTNEKVDAKKGKILIKDKRYWE